MLVFKIQKVDLCYNKVSKYRIWKLISERIQKISKHFIEWFIIHMISMFFFISIVNDAVDFMKHIILSLCSLIFIVAASIYLYKTRFRIFNFAYIKEMEKEYNGIGDFTLSKR